jgi:hypothetical protein
LKGCEKLMSENKIGLILLEVIFSEQYRNIPPFHEILRFLLDRNFSLVTFYHSHYQEDLLSWTDVLFINNQFKDHLATSA